MKRTAQFLVPFAALVLMACGSKSPCSKTDEATFAKRTECRKDCQRRNTPNSVCIERCYGSLHGLNCDLCQLKIKKGVYKEGELAACLKYEEAPSE